MVATIPRSGSTHFCMELWRSGVLGAPMEYPNAPYITILKNRLNPVANMIEYWSEIKRRRTSPNGIFGYKMFMTNYMECAKDYPELLQEIAPDKVIFLTRKNIVAQAISYSRAIQSKAWFAGVAHAKEPEYDPDHIQSCENAIRMQTVFWEEMFLLTEAQVYRVTYEDLLESPHSVIEGVCDHVGVKFNGTNAIDVPPIQVQRNAESRGWMERYLAEGIRSAEVTPA